MKNQVKKDEELMMLRDGKSWMDSTLIYLDKHLYDSGQGQNNLANESLKKGLPRNYKDILTSIEKKLFQYHFLIDFSAKSILTLLLSTDPIKL